MKDLWENVNFKKASPEKELTRKGKAKINQVHTNFKGLLQILQKLSCLSVVGKNKKNFEVLIL